MVHRKYIKIDGKTYGPYYYHSYREGNKIKKKYVKISKKERRVKNIQEKRNALRIFEIIYAFIALIIIIATIISYFAPSSLFGETFLPEELFSGPSLAPYT